MLDPHRQYTVPQLAREIGRSAEYITDAIACGELRVHRTRAGGWRFIWGCDAIAWIEGMTGVQRRTQEQDAASAKRDRRRAIESIRREFGVHG